MIECEQNGLGALEASQDPSARNALALRLAETRDPRILEVLLALIAKPELRDERGTLVHCLRFYKTADHFNLLVSLVCEGNWEVAHEAYGMLSDIDAMSGDQVVEGVARIDAELHQETGEAWRKALLDDLREMVE